MKSHSQIKLEFHGAAVTSDAMKTVTTILFMILIPATIDAVEVPMDGRKLRVILNMDDSSRLVHSPGKDITVQWHRDDLLRELIATNPGVYAQCGGDAPL